MFDLVADVAGLSPIPALGDARSVSRSDSADRDACRHDRRFQEPPRDFHLAGEQEAAGECPRRLCRGPAASICSNNWNFRPDAGRAAALIHFEVDFAFKNRLFEMLAGQMFDRALRKMIGAFETRAPMRFTAGRLGRRIRQQQFQRAKRRLKAHPVPGLHLSNRRRSATTFSPGRHPSARGRKRPFRPASSRCRRPGPAMPVIETATSAPLRDKRALRHRPGRRDRHGVQTYPSTSSLTRPAGRSSVHSNRSRNPLRKRQMSREFR